jgi:hypothetical protein
MNGGGYTFIKANENGSEFWMAVREMPVEVGETLYFKTAMEMKNFESKSLNRKFDSIWFVDNVSKTPANDGAMSGNSAMPGMAPSASGHTKPKVDAENVKVDHLSDGETVATINKNRKALAGKKVKIRGIVTKYNGGIMNRNWIHIQDGTQDGANIDVTATSDQAAKVGDTVVIEGTVTVDKDFGAGYFYDVIIENATVTVEQKS